MVEIIRKYSSNVNDLLSFISLILKILGSKQKKMERYAGNSITQITKLYANILA